MTRARAPRASRLRAPGSARPVSADRRDDGRSGVPFDQPFDPAGEVVDLPRFLDAVHDRSGVAPTVPRVEDDRHARQVRRADAVDELRRLEPGRLLFDALRIVGRAELGREVGDRDLHRIADRDRPHVGDGAAGRDLRGLSVHVLGVDAAGEPHDDRRVERFSALQPVDREPALLVRAELEGNLGRIRGGRRSAEDGQQKARRDPHDLSLLGLERSDAARLADLAIALGISGKPLRDPPEAFRAPCRRRHAVRPARRVRGVSRKEGLDGDLPVRRGQAGVRHAEVGVAPQEAPAAIGSQDVLAGGGVVGQAPDEGVDALSGKRAGGQEDLVAVSDRDANFRGNDDDFLRRGGDRKQQGGRRRGPRGPPSKHGARASGRHAASRRGNRSRARRRGRRRKESPRRGAEP